jgi:pyrimidine operon attenuation protein/uracil phosphoribosyltransferase
MPKGLTIHDSRRFALTIERLCQHLIENHGDFADSCLIGIQTGGVLLGQRIANRLEELTGNEIPFGKLDITFYRDDFRIRQKPLEANPTEIDFLIEDKRVILLDDVLFSGRTTVSAMAAIQDFGRPRQVELLVMVDRRLKRVVPVQPNYFGIKVDTIGDAHVDVQWRETNGEDRIILLGS